MNSRTPGFEPPDRPVHEPLCFVTRSANSPVLAASSYNKVTFDDYPINDIGSWDVAGGHYVCQKAGRVTTETTCVFFTGTSGSDAVQLVVRVDDSSGNLVARFVLNQFGLVPNSTFYSLAGVKSFGVELGMRLYPELFVQSSGSYLFGNTNAPGTFYNAFCAYFVP